MWKYHSSKSSSVWKTNRNPKQKWMKSKLTSPSTWESTSWLWSFVPVDQTLLLFMHGTLVLGPFEIYRELTQTPKSSFCRKLNNLLTISVISLGLTFLFPPQSCFHISAGSKSHFYLSSWSHSYFSAHVFSKVKPNPPFREGIGVWWLSWRFAVMKVVCVREPDSDLVNSSAPWLPCHLEFLNRPPLFAWSDLLLSCCLSPYSCLSGWKICLQCRRYRRLGFDPWVRKIPWRRKWQPTPVFSWTGESGRLRSLGLQRVGHGWGTNTHTHAPFTLTDDWSSCLSRCLLHPPNSANISRSSQAITCFCSFHIKHSPWVTLARLKQSV